MCVCVCVYKSTFAFDMFHKNFYKIINTQISNFIFGSLTTHHFEFFSFILIEIIYLGAVFLASFIKVFGRGLKRRCSFD